MIYLIIGFVAGGILGAVILYFALKSSMVSRSSYDGLNTLSIKTQSDLENSTLKIQELNQNISKEKELNILQQDLLDDLKNEFSKISAEHSSLNIQFQELKQLNQKQTSQIETHILEKQSIFAKNSELSAKNEGLQKSLDTQKDEIIKIQEEFSFRSFWFWSFFFRCRRRYYGSFVAWFVMNFFISYRRQ